MKKIFSLMLLCATIFFASCSSDDDPTIVESVSLDKATLSIAVGETATLTATVTPNDATLKEVSWISCDNAIATVSDEGVVTAISKGEAIISVITASEGKIASCVVTVTSDDGTIEWAKGNLKSDGANGAKIGEPTEASLYFQYGSLVGWGGEGDNPEVLPVGYEGSRTWDKDWIGDPTTDNAVTGKGDPCRYYLKDTWRLPTQEEYLALFGNDDYLTTGPWKAEGSFTSNSESYATNVDGLKFRASGSRGNNGLSDVGMNGYYWSVSPADAPKGYSLRFNGRSIAPDYKINHYYGLSVRCVRDK